MNVFSTFFKGLVLCTITTILPLRSSAQHLESGLNEPLKIQRIKLPVKLDGLSNESAWEGIKSLPMVMITPIFDNEPSERTEILLGYDDEYLYAVSRQRVSAAKPSSFH